VAEKLERGGTTLQVADALGFREGRAHLQVADELEGKGRRTAALTDKGRRAAVLEEKGEGGGA
jgi:hypothetical protein